MKNFYLEKLEKVKNFYSATLEKMKNFYSEKLEKMKNAMARKVTMAESKQENSTTLQTINTTKNTVEKKSLPEKATRSIGIKKRFLKTKNVYRVTFRLPKVAAPDAKSVSIVGDFNNWNTHANPMKKLKDGDYSIHLDLEPGREYQFRCLIDELKWENDRNADKYARSVYGNCDNSVVIAGY
jgi:1,4-alpha-glucan branching enzyme